MKKKCLSQLISLLVASTAAQGLLTAHAFATSDVIIDTPTDSLQIDHSTDLVHITDTGSLTGAPTTALNVSQNVKVRTLTNDGIIKDATDTSNFGNPKSSSIVQIDGAVGAFTNTGTIFSADRHHYGNLVTVGASGVVDSFTNSGIIQSGNHTDKDAGKVNNAGHIITLTNTVDGTISGYRGIYNSGTIDNLNNAGSISAHNNENALWHGWDEKYSAIYNQGTIGTLRNSGTLQADTDPYYTGAGILNYGTIKSLINDNKIIGSTYGVRNERTIDTIENNGLIAANNTSIYINGYNNAEDNTTGKIINNGEVTADSTGIYISNLNNPNNKIDIVNNGTLSGGEHALFIEGYYVHDSTNVTLMNTGLIKGDIYSGSIKPLIINGGTTTQGILTGLNNTGFIINSGSGVVFGTGSLLLDDNVIVYDTVQNSAASLQVNNSITISGNYHQSAAATLISGISDLANPGNDFTADTGYGRLNVTGNANIDASSSVKLLRTGSTYNFAEGQRYVVINAAGAETDYNADKLNYQAVGYNGTVIGSVYKDGASKALVLTIGAEPKPSEPTAPTEPTKNSMATIPSALASLGGLGNYSGISPQLLELYNASRAIEGTQEANRVGERLSPMQNINATFATAVVTSTVQAVVGAHIDAVRNPSASGNSGVATGDDYASNWIVWGQPFGGYARQESTDDVSGYSAKFGGLILGADRALGDDWRLGAAVNYSNTSVHGKDNLSGNTSTADNYGVIGYAGYTGDPWYLNLSAGVNRQNYSSVRRADFTGFSGAANGKFNGQSITLQTEFGYPLTLPADVVLTPLASLTYGYQHVDGYKETGGNGMALDVGSLHSQSVVSDIGARIEKTFATGMGNLTPFAQVSWIHQYDDRQVSSRASYAADTIGETSFITKGAAPVEDMAGLAIGSTLYDANELSFDARYDLQAGDRYQAHTFSLRLRKTF
ncbi:autotransporter domain-containing protein [Pseudescherichia vulneris]|uniref:autotransporter family protein n=1 Tax=Pseudescherichia vulneris TaxID=566 RepID=UPI003CC91204